jgi:oligosaccharide repeat unit polymerase
MVAKLSLLLGSFIVAAIGAAQFASTSTVSTEWATAVSTAVIVWGAIYILSSLVHYRTAYLFTTVYVACLGMFHFGAVVPVALGIFDLDLTSRLVRGIWRERAAWLSVVALGSMGIGVAIAWSVDDRRMRRKNSIKEGAKEANPEFIYWTGIGMLCASLVALGMLIYEGGNLLKYSRMDFYHGAVRSRGLALFLWTLPAACTLIFVGAKSRAQRVSAYLLLLVAIPVMALSGYRSSLFFPLLTGVVLWHKTGHRIPKTLVIAGLVLLPVAIPAISMLRAVGPYEKITANKFEESVKGTDMRSGFIEMGGTLGVLAEAIRLVPNAEPFRWGWTYVVALRESIPNVRFEMSGSGRQEATRNIISKREMLQGLPPSDWITYYVDQNKFRAGEGIGFSAVAEPYINFGLPGVVVYFISLGLMLALIDGKQLLMHPYWIVFCGAVLWTLNRTVRNDFDNFLKPLVFLTLIAALWHLGSRLLPIRIGRQAYRRSNSV